MFYEFAARKATVITQLQRLNLTTQFNDDDSSDVEISDLMNESSLVDVDSDESLDFC